LIRVEDRRGVRRQELLAEVGVDWDAKHRRSAAMSNFDRPGRDPDYRMTTPGAPRNSGSWIVGAVVAVLAIVAIGYAFGDRIMGMAGMSEHRAAATDTPEPAVSPSAPASPSSTPKP
jgi:hypothetical protein